MPTLEQVGMAVLLVAVVPFKVVLFFFLLSRFRLRVRTSMLTAFSLANYSEFGLIIGTIGVTSGWPKLALIVRKRQIFLPVRAFRALIV